eukprot:scaffold7553_cov77-Isochrysis_galbana.AAC.2
MTHAAAQAILGSAVGPDTPAIAASWHSALLGAWPHYPPAQPQALLSVAHAVVGCCNALAASGLRHMPGLLLLLTATGAPPDLAAHAARLVRAHQLLSWLTTTAADRYTGDGCTSVMEIVARRCALPPQLSHAVAADAAGISAAAAAAAAAALLFTLDDVCLADAAAPAATPPHSLAVLLAACGLWRPLAAYLRLLRSTSPLHAHLLAHAELHAGRYGRAAAAFRLAITRATASSTFSLADLNLAARVPALPREMPLQVSTAPASPLHQLGMGAGARGVGDKFLLFPPLAPPPRPSLPSQTLSTLSRPSPPPLTHPLSRPTQPSAAPLPPSPPPRDPTRRPSGACTNTPPPPGAPSAPSGRPSMSFPLPTPPLGCTPSAYAPRAPAPRPTWSSSPTPSG